VVGPQLEAELQARNKSADVGDQVKHTLERSLAGKRPTLQHVARELRMSARTLRRRLTEAGVSFQHLVEDTRRELARHYLKHSTVELSEIASFPATRTATRFSAPFAYGKAGRPVNGGCDMVRLRSMPLVGG